MKQKKGLRSMLFVPGRMKWIVGEQVGMKRKKKREGKEVPYWHERMNERGKKTLCYLK